MVFNGMISANLIDHLAFALRDYLNITMKAHKLFEKCFLNWSH